MSVFRNKHTIPTIIIIIASIISLWLVIKVVGNWPWENSSEIDWSKGSKFGDLIGGILSFLSIVLLYFTIRNQLYSYERSQFESTFFQLLSFHRENVANFSYKPPSNKSGEIVKGEKVILHIFREIQKANDDINNYYGRRGFPSIDKYLEENRALKEFYDRIKKERPDVPFNNLLILDIAYLIVYYGLSDESQNPLEIAINKNYCYKDFIPLINHLKSKSAKWDKEKRKNDYPAIIGRGYNYKYYGGHQIRLGHYFRHLYQLVHFVNKQTFLSYQEKYDYLKTLRAQLSTYEQGVLLYNSLSSLGYKWEYQADPIGIQINKNNDFRLSLNNELITKYNLIKNLPQGIIKTFGIQMFYNDVKFESFESQKTRRSEYIKHAYK